MRIGHSAKWGAREVLGHEKTDWGVVRGSVRLSVLMFKELKVQFCLHVDCRIFL